MKESDFKYSLNSEKHWEEIKNDLLNIQFRTIEEDLKDSKLMELIDNIWVDGIDEIEKIYDIKEIKSFECSDYVKIKDLLVFKNMENFENFKIDFCDDYLFLFNEIYNEEKTLENIRRYKLNKISLKIQNYLDELSRKSMLDIYLKRKGIKNDKNK